MREKSHRQDGPERRPVLALSGFAALAFTAASGLAQPAQPEKPEASATNVSIEPTLMSWGAMDRVAAAIAQDVSCRAGSKRIVVVTRQEALLDADTLAYCLTELRSLATEYAALSCARPEDGITTHDTGRETVKTLERVTTSLDAMSAMLTSLVGIIGLFHSDVALTGVSVTLDSDALAALVAGKLVRECGSTRLLSLSGGSQLTEALRCVREQRAMMQAVCAETDEFKRLEARLTSITTLLATADPVTKLALAGRIAQAEALLGEATVENCPPKAVTEGESSRGPVLVLFVKPVAMGGTNLVKNNLFTGARISHAGGAAATYALTDRDGDVIAANAYWSYDGYAKNPTGHRVGPEAFSNLPQCQ